MRIDPRWGHGTLVRVAAVTAPGGRGRRRAAPLAILRGSTPHTASPSLVLNRFIALARAARPGYAGAPHGAYGLEDG
jgi:hypothetical protein